MNRIVAMLFCIMIVSGCNAKMESPTEPQFVYGPKEKIRLIFLGLNVFSDKDYHRLSERERFVWDIYWVEAEYMNGGTDQVFWNFGDHVPATIEAMKTIGAQTTASVLEQACAVFPDGKPSPDQESRREHMRKFSGQDKDVFSRHEAEMFKEDVFGQLLAYWKKQEPPENSGSVSSQNKRQVLRMFVDLPVNTEDDYKRLSERERFLWDICWFEASVSQKGGLTSCFWFTHSDHAPETLAALRKIGAPETHRLFEQLCSFYPGGRPSQDPVARSTQHLQLVKTFQNSFAGFSVQDGLVKYGGWEEDLFALLLRFWEEQR